MLNKFIGETIYLTDRLPMFLMQAVCVFVVLCVFCFGFFLLAGGWGGGGGGARYLSIFLYVLTPEGDIRRVPGNQVLGVS